MIRLDRYPIFMFQFSSLRLHFVLLRSFGIFYSFSLSTLARAINEKFHSRNDKNCGGVEPSRTRHDRLGSVVKIEDEVARRQQKKVKIVRAKALFLPRAHMCIPLSYVELIVQAEKSVTKFSQRLCVGIKHV